MTMHDWLSWTAYAFFGLAFCYFAEFFWWGAPDLQILGEACLICSGIFFTATELYPADNSPQPVVEDRRRKMR